jgi:hypothetical protein
MRFNPFTTRRPYSLVRVAQKQPSVRDQSQFDPLSGSHPRRGQHIRGCLGHPDACSGIPLGGRGNLPGKHGRRRILAALAATEVVGRRTFG